MEEVHALRDVVGDLEAERSGERKLSAAIMEIPIEILEWQKLHHF